MNYFLSKERRAIILIALIEISLIANQINSQVFTELPSVVKYLIYEKNYYHRECELIVQNELERTFMSHKTGSFPNEAIVRAFPYENLFKQIFTELMIYILPFFLVLSMFTTVSGVLKVKKIILF